MAWALITGGSGGLGRAFAHQLALREMDVVLTSRTTSELEQVAASVHDLTGVDTRVVAADLSAPEGRATLLDTLAHEGIQVHTLVNNAGFGSIGAFAELSADRLDAEVALNVGGVVHLTRALLPDMLAAHDGEIVNVASTAAFQPMPTMAVYAASKAFVLSFTEALWDELKGTGVQAIALCPGPTDTGFFDHAGDDSVLARRRTPDQVVTTCLDALAKGRPAVVDGRFNAAQAYVAKIAPARIAAPLARRVLGAQH